MKRKHAIVPVVALLLALAGCGGGSAGGPQYPLKTDVPHTPATTAPQGISGTAFAPAGSSLARSASRSAAAISGLSPVSDGTPVYLYTIDENGIQLGAPLSTTQTSGGNFLLPFPSTSFTPQSNLVVAVGRGAEQMRSFIVSNSQLAIDPVSEYVVEKVAARAAALSSYTMNNIADIYSHARVSAEQNNLSFAAAASVAQAVSQIVNNASIAAATLAAINTAEGNASGNTEEEDAFGNIMHTGYPKITSVNFTPPAHGLPCNVTAVVTPVGYQDEKAQPVFTTRLVYSINSGTETQTAMTYNGSNNWSGTIPAQTAGANVKLYVKITDNFGNTTTGAISSSTNLVEGVPDMDNSADIVPNNLDLLGYAANYDNERVYVRYNVQGIMDGGTVDPPYIQLYGIKFTNPDIEQSEGLMVGKLWANIPLSTNKAVQDQFMPLIMQAKEYVDKIDKVAFQHVLDTGMIVLDIGKLMSGNIVDGLLFSADPQGAAVGGVFTGSIKRSALGANPSGFIRIIILTAANASIDSFMPIPINCTHFLNLYFSSYDYTAS